MSMGNVAKRSSWGLSCLVLAACDAAVVGRLDHDAQVDTRCVTLDDASAPAAATLAYGGASAATGTNFPDRVNGGRQFEVTAECLTIVELGVWDHAQDGLSRSHAVALFALDAPGADAIATPIPGGSALVLAGSDVALEDGFRLAALPRPLLLEPGFYAVIAYDFSSEEPYGDGGSLPPPGSGVRDVGFDPFEFSTNPSPSYPAGDDGTSHSTASFRYVNRTP
jgi:hypothetical protein